MRKIIAVILMICGLGIGFFVIPSLTGSLQWNNAVSGIKEGDEAAITEKLSNIAELSVLDFKYSNATSITDSREIDRFSKKVNIPFTKKSIVMIYNGDIKIGVDADRITVRVVKGANNAVEEVTVGIPPLKITSNDIDRESISYPLEKNNILNKIKSEDYAKMEEDGKEKMAEAVMKNGAMERAENELKETITAYLTALFGEEVSVKFEAV